VIHRHLDVPPGTPPESLPSAAIVDILDRGDLDDWQPLAAAVARDPHGELARRIERLVRAYPMYGTTLLWLGWIERLRERVR
jgi:hypothetical protein